MNKELYNIYRMTSNNELVAILTKDKNKFFKNESNSYNAVLVKENISENEAEEILQEQWIYQ